MNKLGFSPGAVFSLAERKRRQLVAFLSKDSCSQISTNMKFPSIFRVNQPRRFQINPRHYDPVKEEIHQRTENIKRELEARGVLESEDREELDRRYSHGSSIRGAFTSGSPIKKQPSTVMQSAGMMRMIIFVLLVAGFGGYLYIGPDFFYYLLYLGAAVALLVSLFKLKPSKKKAT